MDFLQALIDLIFFPFSGAMEPEDPLMIALITVLIGISVPLLFWRVSHAFTNIR